MFTGMELMSCQHLAMPASVMQHVIRVESSANPYAIGVVGGQLVRQPRSLGEALATVHMLDAKGYNYSLGIAQINRTNLGKYGLDSYEQAFDPCPNVEAGSRILAGCYASSGGDWGKAFSCYYSGDFVTGYRDGYVQKIYASVQQPIGGSHDVGDAAIPLLTGVDSAHSRSAPTAKSFKPAYRVAMRSEMIDGAATSMAAMIGPAAETSFDSPGQGAETVANGQVQPNQTNAASLNNPSPATSAGIFVPEVRGPNDPVPMAAAPAVRSVSGAVSPSKTNDQADLRQSGSDASFVF